MGDEEMTTLTVKEARQALKAIVGETNAMLAIGTVGPTTDQARRDNLIAMSLIAVMKEQENIAKQLSAVTKPVITK